MAKKALTKSEVNKWNRVNAELKKSDDKLALDRQVQNIVGNIKTIQGRRVTASIVLCKYYAARALQTFRKFQMHNVFWNNQTNTAYNTVFASDFVEKDAIGWFIAHLMEYGIYLELANDRKHEALRPIVVELEAEFKEDLKRIWG